MLKIFRNITSIVLALGILAAPLSYFLIRHHCNHSNTEYLILSYRVFSCHPQSEKSCVIESPACCAETITSGLSNTCNHPESSINSDTPSLSQICCTNQISPLQSKEIFPDYRISPRFENPEIPVLEKFVLISDLTDIVLQKFTISDLPVYIFPPNELIHHLSRLII